MIRRVESLAISIALLGMACSGTDRHPESDAAAVPPSRTRFVDRAAETGLAFTHRNGMTGKFYEAEIYPPGVALFDFDNDGDLDVYVVQGAFSGGTAAGSPPIGDRLFRNDLTTTSSGSPSMRFTDVTAPSGV